LRLRRKVFLIGDQPVLREGLALLIDQEPGLEVCGRAANTQAVSRLISQLKPDIVVIDLSADGKSEFELIGEITACSSSLPVLVLSANRGAIYAEHALRAGAKGYVLKQEAVSAVVHAIRQVLGGRTYLSKDVSTSLLENFIDVLSGVQTGEGASRLSSRELLVLQLTGEGMTTKQIADKLCVSVKTVETYRVRIKTKLNIKTHPDFVQYAIRWTKSPGQPWQQ